MLWNGVLVAAVISIQAATPAVRRAQVYKIELAGNQTVLAEDVPKDSGSLVLFHRFPGGMLVSVKKADVRRVTISQRVVEDPKRLRTGNEIMIGTLGGPGSSGSGAAGKDGITLPPGENKDGTALLNPDRPYKPEWDSRQVPGMNIPYPASPNDYGEGRTLGYPPATAVQEAPGEPPKMAPSSGEPPKAPQ